MKRFETSTLKVSIQPGILITIKAQGFVNKKARRTALLLLLRTLRKTFMYASDGVIFHNDSSMRRGFTDFTSSASLYQATDIATEAQRFGHRLRAMRTGIGVTQKEMALLTGVTRTYISKIERGKHNLHPQTQERLMNLLKSYYLMKPVALPEAIFDRSTLRLQSDGNSFQIGSTDPSLLEKPPIH